MADPLLSELDPDASPVDFALAQRRAAQARAVQSLDDSPDDASRADQMARATGAQPALVYGNLENFEKQYKARLASDILENNQYLRDYVSAHPLAAKVSNDDWGALDAYTNALSKVVVGKDVMSIAGEAMKGFKEGFGEDELGAKVHNFLGNKGIINSLFTVFQTNPAYYAPRIVAGLIQGGAAGAAQFVMGQTGNEAWRNRLYRDLLVAPQVAIPELAGEIVPPELNALAQKAVQKGEPWARMGRVPPPGDPDFDIAHKEQVKIDMGNIDEAHKLLQQTSTLGRSPDLAALISRIVTDGNIDISAEAVRKLYGGNPGEPIESGIEDGKLGWISNLKEQLALAETHGGDISVPLSEWLARVDPDLHKELGDFIRPREGGMTLEESKAPAAPTEEEPVGTIEPITALRQSAGILPTSIEGIVPETAERGTIKFGDEEIPTATFKGADALAIAGQKQLTGVAKALQTFLGNRLEAMAGDTPVWLIPAERMAELNKAQGFPPNTPAYYDGSLHAVVVREDIAKGAYGPSFASRILYHELAHAATLREMDEFPELKGAVRDLMNEVMDIHAPASARSGRLVGSRLGEFHYAFKDEREFVAEAFSNPDLQELLSSTPISKELAARLEMDKGNSLWDAVRKIIKDLITKLIGTEPDDSIMDGLLRLGPTFEEAQLRLKEGGKGVAAAPEITEGSITDIETKIRGLMDRPTLQRYLERIEKQQEEDAKFHEAQARKRAAETQTKEWKANEAEMKSTVRAEVRNRSDLAADRLFREGKLFDRKVGKVTLDSARLTDEQKAALPKEYYGQGGENPDSLANAFGYRTGDAMVNAIIRVKQERELEGLTPAAHLNRLVDAETERRMRKEYGSLDEQITKEMEDHVVSPTQIDLLHDKMIALGMAAKTNEPLKSPENMRMAVMELVDKSPAGSHSAAKYLQASNRAYGRVRDALLEDDIHGAFKAQQEQVYSLLLADEAKKLEKEEVRDDKLIKKYSARAPKSVDPETANFIHDIMARTFGVARTQEDMLRQRGLISNHKTLEDFVTAINNDSQIWNQDPNAMPLGQRLAVPDFLRDPGYKADLDKMTVEEKRAIMGAIRTMDKYASTVHKYEVRGSKEDLGKVLDGLIERLKAAVDYKKLAKGGGEPPVNPFRTIGSYVLNPETWFNRLDLGNSRGPFNQLIMRPIVEGQYTLKTLERQHAKEWREIGEPGDLRKKIDNPLFKDSDGSLIDLDKGNLISIISNMGNKLQREKLARGWNIDNPDKIWSWLWSLAQKGEITKEDFDRAGRMGKFFERIFEKSERMYSELTGWTPPRIPLGTIQTPWGDMPEWYHPLIPRPDKWSPTKASDMYEESGYYKPATATGYTQQRTGAIYPIQLDFNAIPGKIKQMLNDIAMHSAVSEVNKILGNRRFKDTFAQYYGSEYMKGLEPWLRDAAGQRKYDPGRLQGLESAIHFFQENMSTLLIGFNIGTVAKHAPTALAFSMREVGPTRFLDSMSHIFGQTDTGQTRWRFAMENSEELQNRLRSMRESISATNQDLFKKYNWDHKFFAARDLIQTIGAMPVAGSDFASAVPMWDAAYRKFLEENPGASHGDAVYDANRAVRRTHGSTIVSNRPAIMRANPYVNTFMPFYNFFNNAANRLYEYGWQAKLAAQGRTLPEMEGFEKEQFEKGYKHIPEILGGFLTFGLIVSLIEQAVDPIQPDPKHPFLHAAKIVTRAPLAMVPGPLRDIVNAYYGGHDPQAGLVGTFYQDIAKPLKDVTHVADPARVIKSFNNAFGALTGLTYGAVGNVGSYINKIARGQEVPHDPLDLVRGYRYGTQKVKK